MEPFAHKDDVTEGTILKADGGFTCIEEGALCTVMVGEDHTPYVLCKDGCHYLGGQLDNNNRYVGFYKVSQ